MFKKLLPVIAILLVFAMISPSIMAAELNQNETVVTATSENESEYDEMANIADSSSMTNDQTWNPTYNGIFMGSSTKESLFKFNEVTAENATLGLAWKFRLTSNQIMSGVSEWTIRLPLYNTGDLEFIGFYMDRLITDVDYGFATAAYPMMLIGVVDGTIYTDYTHVISTTIDPTDLSVADGDHEYTIDDRVYYRAIAPLFPDVDYVSFLVARYSTDSNFSYYMVPQDVCGDGNVNTTVARYNYNSHLDSYVIDDAVLATDPGFSFDFRVGMGSGVFGKLWNLDAGSNISYGMTVAATGAISGYHSIMVPFLAGDKVINATVSVDVYDDTSLLVDTWTAAATNYQDYIMACSAATIATNGTLNLDITITVNTAESLALYFRADIDDVDVFLHNQIIEQSIIKFEPLASYLVSVNQVDSANVILTGTPINPIPEELEKNTDWAFIVASLLFPGLIPFNLATQCLSGGEGVVTWLVRNAGEFLYAGVTTVIGWITNAIDAIWDVLVGIGEFLWAVGEWIWEALEWLAEQIIEYGAILLGLLIIGVILMIFFVAIYAQLKLWGIVWSLAEGDLKSASAQAQDLASTASSAAGKIGGLI